MSSDDLGNEDDIMPMSKYDEVEDEDNEDQGEMKDEAQALKDETTNEKLAAQKRKEDLEKNKSAVICFLFSIMMIHFSYLTVPVYFILRDLFPHYLSQNWPKGGGDIQNEINWLSPSLVRVQVSN